MKVLLCANDSEGTTVGGPDVWIRRLAYYLKNNGVEVYLCFFYYGNLKNCDNINHLKNSGFPIFSVSNVQYSFTEQRVFQFLEIAEKIRPNIVVANLCVPALFSSAYLKKYNIPVIPVIHANNEFYIGIIDEFIIKIGKFQIENVVTVSEYLGNKCSRNSDAKVTVISCGTEVPKFKTSPPREVLNIVYIGRFRQWQKRIYDVVDAFCIAANTIPDTNYYLYGYGPEGEEAKMQQIIEKHNVDDSVIIKGLIDNSQLKSDISDKHVVVLMSDYEGLPMALIEAMAVGLVPVCLSEESGVNEVVLHNKNGLLIEDRDQSFINAIQYIKDNTLQWTIMSKCARETVLNKYSDEVEDRKWLELLRILEQSHNTAKSSLVFPKTIKLPQKNIKINEDVRAPQPPSIFAKVRKKVRLRTRIRNFFGRND